MCYWFVLCCVGSTGATGSSGAPGDVGPNGLPGSTGPLGSTGATGYCDCQYNSQLLWCTPNLTTAQSIP